MSRGKKQKIEELAPEFKGVKNRDYLCTAWTLAIAIFIGFSLLSKMAPQETGASILMKTPGVTTVMKLLGYIKTQ